MNIHSIKISSSFSGQRIDNFLRVYLKKIPKSMIYRIIRTGAVRVNKKRVKFQYKLKIGDFLRIPIIKQTKVNILNMQCCLEEIKCLRNAIIYEDDYLLALNKPAGLAVHRGSGLNFGIIEGLRALRPSIQFLELVHRLDRATSGVLLIAKKRSALIYLHEQLRLQKMKKKYLALVHGVWDLNTKTISSFLCRKNVISQNNVKMISKILPKEKLAITHFYIKERFNTIATLLIIIPITGRTHQIRIHAQYANHPIIGDDMYGNCMSNVEFKKYGLNRLFLHAFALSFYHPNTKKFFHMQAPIDQSLNNFLCYLRNLKSISD